VPRVSSFELPISASHIHLLRVLPLVGCRSKTPTGLNNKLLFLIHHALSASPFTSFNPTDHSLTWAGPAFMPASTDIHSGSAHLLFAFRVLGERWANDELL
jgi:hypothetical protein